MMSEAQNSNKHIRILGFCLGLLGFWPVLNPAEANENPATQEIAQGPPPGNQGAWGGGFRPGPPPPRQGGPSRGREALRDLIQSLGLSRAQKIKIMPILMQLRQEKMAAKSKGKQLSAQEKIQKMNQKVDRIKKAIGPHLNPAQKKQLETGLAEMTKHIKIRMMGPAGHLMEALQGLNLNQDQKRKLQTLAANMRENHQKDLNTQKNKSSQERFAAMKSRMESFRAQLEKILTPSQMEQLKRKMMDMRQHWRGPPGPGPGFGGPPGPPPGPPPPPPGPPPMDDWDF